MAKNNSKKQIKQYEHTDKKRANNPHVGLVTPTSDPDTGQKKTYEYDPHLDPQLQWAGKAEHTSFEVPTVSLHVHERIDPNTIIETVKRERHEEVIQTSLFEEYRQKPLREAIDFYKHKEGWTNRLIAGDSLLVMNSLLEKEGMAGKVQMVYFDPPYGIKYGSNFQPFVNKRDVKDGKDEDLSAEPEMIKAFRDTWELGIHSYLTYLRDRLLLSRELLDESGSVFVQISDENVHHVREILDEVFGVNNFIVPLSFKKTGSMSGNFVSGITDTILWYAKDKSKAKFRKLYQERSKESADSGFPYIEFEDGTYRRIKPKEFSGEEPMPVGRRFQTSPVMSAGAPKDGPEPVNYEGRKYYPASGNHWKISAAELEKVGKKERLLPLGKTMTFKKYLDEAPYTPLSNIWLDTMESTYAVERFYVVQTAEKPIARCVQMVTDPGDLVFDPTCGSGTTAKVCEEYGRRWITCDTSRVALNLAKKRLVTNQYDYFKLKHIKEGIGSGLIYKSVPKITLKSLATGEGIPQIELFDQPEIEKTKTRITGPFTVEAVPASSGGPNLENGQGVEKAKSFDELEEDDNGSDTSIARTGETLRQSEWRDELLRAGVRAKGGNIIQFTRVEPLSGTKYIQAEAETKEDIPKKVMVVFGPEHAPLEQRMVENAWQEARAFKPEMLLFCAFQFDEEAAKDIDELTPAIAGMQLLKAQMNADLLTDDLRKKRSSNESFWLVGQPDVKVHKLEKGKVQVEVMGFDYYNPKTGNVESGGKKNIAMWMLDTNYDNRSLFPSQVFFPMAGSGDGWDKLAKNLKAEIDEEKIEAFKGTVSLEFEPGSAIAVKIIDDRGIESLRVINM
ncbi:MAG: site-specific DNA-methyltransferase [Firmicutes bacterium HGW-Firmicutes-17]|nr:MAG: site-specific DNA-methyltransferase [Firmicutes bacterium HGW-Firmicutes-17]